MTAWLKIKEASGVAEARRRARRNASTMGFDSTKVEHVAIVATEIAQNVLRHGGGGHVLIQRFGAPGMERLFIVGADDGPGVARIDRMLKDGNTTAKSPGTGLGAMRRLSDRLDIDTRPGEGMVVVGEFCAKLAKGVSGTDHAGLRIPYPGERRCGDGVATRRGGGREYYLLCDGLGHGDKASDAADTAIRTFMNARESEPADMLERLGSALMVTRGAVAAIVSLDRAAGALSYAAIGNIATLIVQGGKTRRMPVRDGLLGGRRSSPHVETMDLDPDGIVIMHSDGIATLRGLERRVPLLNRSAGVIAARMLYEHTRGRDDASVLVARMNPARTL